VSVTIEVTTKASDELLEAMRTLVPQLSSSATPMTMEELEEIVESDASILFVARLGTEIVGTLTLVVFRIPSGLRAWIEDVIVDESARGDGVGESLTRAAIELSGDIGVRSIDLTSRPSRAEANRLYQRIGFVQRETNVYRYSLES
jgi:ribosomal protein S18 acetylase RimI-like enzyme